MSDIDEIKRKANMYLKSDTTWATNSSSSTHDPFGTRLNRYREYLDKIEQIMNSTRQGEIGKLIPYKFHNTLQQNFMRMVIGFITEIATAGDKLYDARNEATYRICKKIYDLMDQHDNNLEGVGLPFI